MTRNKDLQQDERELPPLQSRGRIQLSAVPELPSKEQALQLIQRFARKELNAEDLFIFPTVPATDALDAYFWKQDARSLQNFAEDAANGVAIMNSHRTGGFGKMAELPIGRSFFGRVVPSSGLYGDMIAGDLGKSNFSVLSAAYMLRDHSPNGYNTDEVIRGVEAGTIFDLSVTFIPQTVRCDLCQEDLFDFYACPHIPGLEYEDGMCTATSENAHIIEYSFVYDGALPGSVVLKAEFQAESGQLSRAQLYTIEERYKTLIVPRKSFTGKEELMTTTKNEQRTPDAGDLPVENSDAPPAAEGSTNAETAEKIPTTESSATTEVPSDGAPEDVTTSETPETVVEGNGGEKELHRLAEIGRTYLEGLRQEVLEWGARAQGTEFNRTLWEGLVEKMSVVELQASKDDFVKRAKEVFGNGGRQTEPLDPNNPLGERENVDIPARTFNPSHYKA